MSNEGEEEEEEEEGMQVDGGVIGLGMREG